jgi:hypothetical protein
MEHHCQPRTHHRGKEPQGVGGQTLAISLQLLPASRMAFNLCSSIGVQGVLVRLFLAVGGDATDCDGADGVAGAAATPGVPAAAGVAAGPAAVGAPGVPGAAEVPGTPRAFWLWLVSAEGPESDGSTGGGAAGCFRFRLVVCGGGGGGGGGRL